jgi:hypothetical protein
MMEKLPVMSLYVTQKTPCKKGTNTFKLGGKVEISQLGKLEWDVAVLSRL